MNVLAAQWLVAVAVGGVLVLGFAVVYSCQQLRAPRTREAPAPPVSAGVPGTAAVPARQGPEPAAAEPVGR
jgi:hypothetical protein